MIKSSNISGLVPLSLSAYACRIVTALVLLGLGILVWRTATVLALVFAGCILAIVLSSLACVMARFTPLRGSWALAASTLGLIVVLAGFATLLGWRIADQFGDLMQALRHAEEQLRTVLQQHSAGRRLLQSMGRSSFLSTVPVSHVTSVATSAARALTDCVVIVFIGLFLAADPPLYRRGLLSLIPDSKQDAATDVLRAVVRALRQWLAGVLVAMLCVGVITGMGLWLLGVPLALSLGFLSGLLEAVPYAGPIVAAVPAILVGFAGSPSLALEVAGLYLGVHLFEGYLLVPFIQKRAVALPPALGITAVVIFGVLLGPLGIMLAHPLMVTAITLVRKLYITRLSIE